MKRSCCYDEYTDFIKNCAFRRNAKILENAREKKAGQQNRKGKLFQENAKCFDHKRPSFGIVVVKDKS